MFLINILALSLKIIASSVGELFLYFFLISVLILGRIPKSAVLRYNAFKPVLSLPHYLKKRSV